MTLQYTIAYPMVFLIISIFVISSFGTYHSVNIGKPILQKDSFLISLSIFILYLCSNYNMMWFAHSDAITIFNYFSWSNGTYHLSNIFCITFLIFLMISKSYLVREQYNNFEIYMIYIVLFASFIIILIANDLFTVYLCIEAMNFSFYFLSAYKRRNKYFIEATLKYFIIASLFSIFYIYGCCILYGMTGTFGFDKIKVYANIITEYSTLWNDTIHNFFIHSGVILILSLFLFKLTVAPFHFWALDIYSNINLFNFFLSIIFSKFIYVIILMKLIYYVLYDIISNWHMYNCIFYASGLMSIMVGTIGGIAEYKIKRLFTYSSINHTGFIMICMTGDYTVSIPIIFSYIFCYILMSIILYCVLIACRKNSGNESVEYITDSRNLDRSNKLLAYIIMLLLLSFAGLPPFLGFWSKYLILTQLWLEESYMLFYIILVSNMLSIFYHLRMIRLIFFNEVGMPRSIVNTTYSNSIVILLGISILTIGVKHLDVIISICYALSMQQI